jgi:hypothetical protein
MGLSPTAIKAAEKKGEDVLLPQRGWQWNAYFVALAAVGPKLEIREEKTGFKTRNRNQGRRRRTDDPGTLAQITNQPTFLVDIDKHEKHGLANVVGAVNRILALEPKGRLASVFTKAQRLLSFQLDMEGDLRQVPGIRSFANVIFALASDPWRRMRWMMWQLRADRRSRSSPWRLGSVFLSPCWQLVGITALARPSALSIPQSELLNCADRKKPVWWC